jgi:hypothetical protein
MTAVIVESGGVSGSLLLPAPTATSGDASDRLSAVRSFPDDL